MKIKNINRNYYKNNVKNKNKIRMTQHTEISKTENEKNTKLKNKLNQTKSYKIQLEEEEYS